MPYEIAPTSSFATEEHVQEHLEGLLEDGHDQGIKHNGTS